MTVIKNAEQQGSGWEFLSFISCGLERKSKSKMGRIAN
jgi:hypothetical protein